MSESEPSRVFMFDGDDPEMAQASARARRTFKYFWRELAWERRRIVPGLDVACVKAAFSDGGGPRNDGGPEVEQMWVTDVDFDGRAVSGTLLNSPNWLRSVKEGDPVRLPLARISDWMYVIGGEVYGAYTVQLLRSRMDRAELADHDRAWGLDFGDPSGVRVIPVAGDPAPKRGGGFLNKLAGRQKPQPAPARPPQSGPDEPDHPMSVNMGPSLRKAIADDPSLATTPDENGFTLIHQLAMAGSVTGVRVLLEAGADPDAPTDDGRTPADLARALGWENVLAVLAPRAR
ncbi:MAG TPA: DUF2314 domain-containing protein [Humisphaera sp.]